ncbi:MAG: hypothetical protein PHV74_01000 [Dehalococcoidia bacterium]|nr:hypothetical protein [Dehalococcoidia bacterium]
MSAENRQAGGVTSLLAMAAAISFLLGYFICIIAGLWWPTNSSIILLLCIMGLLVGCFNITGREIMPYLVAAIALVLIGTQQPFTPLDDAWDGLGRRLNDIVHLMALFTAPAALIQAVRAGVSLAAPGD